jgi:transcriptional regulator with XRE-family HTH domain
MHPTEIDQRGIAIYVLRSVRDWTQEDLANAMGTGVGVIADYESGRRRPSQRAIHRAAEAVGALVEDLYELLTALGEVREVMEIVVPLHRKRLAVAIEEACTKIGPLSGTLAQVVLAATKEGKKLPSGRFPAPESAHLLWDRLERHRPEDQRRLVDTVESYQSWDLCELLCEESREAAAEGEDSAVELAELALHVAERVPGDEDGRACVQAFAWAHLGHARRERGDRPGAEEAFARFRQLWQKGASLRPLLLDDARIADLEALVSG